MVFGLGAGGAALVWAVDPRAVVHPWALGIMLSCVAVAAVSAYLFRNGLPRYAEDVAVVSSIGLISIAVLSTRVHADPALFTSYYVWVGFASPMWFPPRRALAYPILTVAVSGGVLAWVGTATALATWIVTTVTLAVAYLIVHILARITVRAERLAAVGEMTSAVGHELRNPLGATTSALLLVQMALEDGDPDAAREYAVLAEHSVARAVSLADDLTAFVGSGRPVLEAVEIGPLLDEVMRGAPPPAGIEVRRDLEVARVQADQSQLAAVLGNLIANAYDALPDGGHVVLGARPAEGDTVDISVHDDGAGIDEGVRDSLFDPFVTTKARGTGLGLAIVVRFVEAQGGRIRCESPPGGGTRMTVRLPKATDGEVAPTGPATPPGPPGPHRDGAPGAAGQTAGDGMPMPVAPQLVPARAAAADDAPAFSGSVPRPRPGSPRSGRSTPAR